MISDELKILISHQYIKLYEKITNKKFSFPLQYNMHNATNTNNKSNVVNINKRYFFIFFGKK